MIIGIVYIGQRPRDGHYMYLEVRCKSIVKAGVRKSNKITVINTKNYQVTMFMRFEIMFLILGVFLSWMNLKVNNTYPQHDTGFVSMIAINIKL